MREKMFLSLQKEPGESGEAVVKLAIDTTLIQGGLLAQLTASEVKVLLAIASHMDEAGESFPSMQRIAELTGISKSTVDTAIKGLLTKRINGFPFLTRRIIGKGARRKSIYSFVVDLDNPITDIVVPEIKVLVPSNGRKNSKQLVGYFCELYKETFGSEYRVSWAKEMGQMKRFSLTIPTDEEVEEIIKVSITEYKKRWATPTFPAPTIGSVTSWIGKQASVVIQNRQKSVSAVSKWDTLNNTEEDLEL